MKRLLGALLIALLCLLPAAGHAEDYEQETREQLEQGVSDILGELELSELEELYGETALSEQYSFRQLLEEISENGLSVISVEDVLNSLVEEFRGAFRENLLYMVRIAEILMITGILRHLPSQDSGASRTAEWAGYLISGGIALTMLIACFGTVRGALDTLFRIVEAITPVLMVLLTGLGGLSGSAVMSPVMAALTGGIFELVELVIYPLMIAGAVLSMASCVSRTVRLDKLAGLMGSLVKWGLGILFTVFLGVSVMKGIAGASIDGIYFKTAKYTIDRVIPVIGGMFADTLDTIMACGLLVKNSVGFAGVFILAGAMIAPLMKLFSCMMLFRAGAALTQPFAAEGAVQMLERMGKTAELAFLVVLTCMAMAFISIALLMGAADMSFMMR